MTFILIIAFLFRVFLSFLVWHPDVNNHIDWGIRFWQYGSAKFYSANVWNFTWPNQPPGTIYIFAGVRKIYEATFGLFGYLHFNLNIFPGRILLFLETNLYPALLKLPAILADLGIAYLVYKIIASYKLPATSYKKNALLGALFFLINPVVWYNSAVWGQTDSIISFFAFLAFYLLLARRLNLALLSFALSLYIKASLLIFLPIFLIVAIRQKYSFKKWLFAVGSSFLVISLLTLPFSQGNPVSWLFYLYKDKVFTNQLQVVSANAFNFWGAIAGVNDSAVEISHNVFWGPISFEWWGYILFGISYIPSLYLVYKKQDMKSLIWALAIASFSSFMLLTNMHERYLYPLFPYLTILTALNLRLLLIYSSISLINFLNLYNFWWVPKIDVLINFLSFGDRLVPRILGFLNFGLFLYLYSRLLRLLDKARI